MYIVDVNKDVSSDFLFCILRLAKHKRQWGHNLHSKELIFFNALTDVRITSQKNNNWVAKYGKKMMLYESIRAFLKISENYDFDHSYNRFFKRIPAVPGTSNIWGLTVCQKKWRIMAGLIWVQTICKGYQQTTLVGKELKDFINTFPQY